VTARSVAAALGCSTAPVFTHFSSMDALHEGLMDAIMDVFRAAVEVDERPDPLVGAAEAWLRFAVAEPRLYEALFLRRHPWHIKWGGIRRGWADHMVASDRYAALGAGGCFALIGRVSIALHGLGLEIWSGRLPADDIPLLVREIAMPVADVAIANGWTNDLHSRRTQTGFGSPTTAQNTHTDQPGEHQ
jgi:AcrR family transcriptional regulator